MFMSLLTGMAAVSGSPYPGEVSEGTGRARRCAYVKHSTLQKIKKLNSVNSAIEEELRDRRVEDRGRANATSSA